MVGVVVSICGPVWVRPESDRLAALPALSVMVAELEIDRRRLQAGRVLAGADRVAEGQRAAAGAAGIGRGAAVVEGQRRGAARHRHRFAQVERQRDGLAGIEVAARTVTRSAMNRRCSGIDLRAGLGQAGERQIGGIAGAVGDGGGVEIDRGGGQRGVFWPAPTV